MPSNLTSGPQRLLTIAEMAAYSGVSYRTLRFYEERGLLQPARVGLARFYAPKDRIRLELISRGKQFGFSLSEIERLIGHASADRPEPVADVTAMLTRDDLIRQIDQLAARREEVQAAIDQLIAALIGKDKSEAS